MSEKEAKQKPKEQRVSGTAELVNDGRGWRLDVAGVVSKTVTEHTANVIKSKWEHDAASKRKRTPKRDAADDKAN